MSASGTVMRAAARESADAAEAPGDGWSFLRSREWLGYAALVVVFVIACCALGTWQLARRAEAQAVIARIEANYDTPPVPLATVLAAPDAAWDEERRWTSVTVEGEYAAEEQLLARTRPREGYPGFEILTPLVLDDGSVLIVNRGWLPTGSAQDLPDDIPAPPAGRVSVVARLTPTEPLLANRTAPEGQVSSIHLGSIDELVSGDVYLGAYGLLATEDPASDTGALALRPVPDEGPHLGYALQWFVFALLSLIGLCWLAVQEHGRRNPADIRVRARLERERRRRSTRRTDADVEDEILDGAE